MDQRGVRALIIKIRSIVQEMFDYVEDHVKPYFERLTGISSVRGVYGGTERQMQVMIDPTKLADRGIAISKVREAIRSRNRDVSGGDLDEGKRRFNVRTVGRYESAADIENTIIDMQDGTPVYLRDVGYARLGHAEKRTLIRQNTEPALAFGPQRKRGTNLLVVMEQVQGAIQELNDGLLREKGIYLTQVTDSTSYVRDAVDMVRFNLLFGGMLALGILLIFLRHGRSTLIVGLAIPLCVIGSFFVISISGRSINVISLAGLAFSIGAVLDASIVVLENIYRHRSMGKSSFDAAYDGTSEVWTAILVVCADKRGGIHTHHHVGGRGGTDFPRPRHRHRCGQHSCPDCLNPDYSASCRSTPEARSSDGPGRIRGPAPAPFWAGDLGCQNPWRYPAFGAHLADGRCHSARHCDRGCAGRRGVVYPGFHAQNRISAGREPADHHPAC